MKSKIVAISALSAGFIAISLIIGAYVQAVDLFALVVASVFALMPLYRNSFVGAFMAYLVGGVIALVCALPTISFTVVFPAYVGFFGLYPIIRHKFIQKNVGNALCLAIGLVWCVGAVFGIYFYYTLVMNLPFTGLPLWVSNNIYVFLGIIGIVFFFIYDRFIIIVKKVLDRYLGRIIK